MTRAAPKSAPRRAASTKAPTPKDVQNKLTDAEVSLSYERRWNSELRTRHRAIDDILKAQEITLGAMRALMRSEGTAASLPPINARYRATSQSDLDDDCPF